MHLHLGTLGRGHTTTHRQSKNAGADVKSCSRLTPSDSCCSLFHATKRNAQSQSPTVSEGRHSISYLQFGAVGVLPGGRLYANGLLRRQHTWILCEQQPLLSTVNLHRRVRQYES